MNRYLVAHLLGALICSAALLGMLRMRSLAEHSQAAADLAEADRGAASRRLQDLRLQAQAAAAAHAPVRSFLTAWQPHLKASSGKDIADSVRSILLAEAAALPVATSAWTVPGGTERRSQTFSLRIAGDLDRVLTWLGRIQSRLPLARIERAQLARFGDGVALDITVAFPTPTP